MTAAADGGGGKDHWAIVASASIDFCASVKRPDLLFGVVYDAFASVKATAVLLLALEPYIRIGKLDTLSPVVMKGFVEAHTACGALGRVERSLLLLDLRCEVAPEMVDDNASL